MSWAIEASPLGRILVAPDVPAGFALFYTTRDLDGRLTPDLVEDIDRLLSARFGISASLTTCTQVHGAVASEAKASRSWYECDSCDALWSMERQTALGIKVADCLPVTIIDSQHEIMANIHSGWRGTVRHITASTVASLLASTPFDPACATAWLGPAIRQCCFEVGDEVVTQFRDSFADVEPFVDRSGSRPHIDVAGVTTRALRELGFKTILDSGLCTRCDGSLFHSYRRDGAARGRTLAIVAH